MTIALFPIPYSLFFPLMIIGHETIRERLRRAAKKERTAQAYLFVGPESVGKRAVAFELARTLIGESFVSDVVTLRPERVEEKGKVKEKAIGVEAVREATRTLGLSGRTAAGNILIVDDAHRLSEEAQNAFLKTLEEPLPGVTVFLVTHEEGAIVPTIASRCERVSFALVPEKVVSDHFPDVPLILRMLGRPGLCKSFREQPEMFGERLRRLETLSFFETLSFSERVSCADGLMNDIPSAERMLSWWVGAIAQKVALSPEIFERRRLLELLGNISATLRDLRRFPGSARLTLEHMFFFKKSVSPLLVRKISTL